MAPYVITVRPRHRRRANVYSIDNIGGVRLDDAVNRVLASMLRRAQGYASDPYTTHRLTEVRSGANFSLLMIAPGKTGQISTILREDGTTIPRAYRDEEQIPLRVGIFYPPGGCYAFVFVERIGRMGTVTFLRHSIASTLASNLREVTVSIDGLATTAALRDSVLKQIVVKTARSGNSRESAWWPDLELRYKFSRRVGFRDVITDQGDRIDRSKVFHLVQSGANEAGIGSGITPDAWDARLTVETPEGATATFDVDSDGPAMSFQIVGANGYPTNQEFVNVCNSALDLLNGQYGVTEQSRVPAPTLWADWDGALVQEPWEVTYFDSDSSGGDS